RIWFHLSRGTPLLCSFRRQSGTCPTLERSGTMKHLFAIAVLLLAVCGRVFGGPASDERELTKLVKAFNRAGLKAGVDFFEPLLHKDYVHHNQRGLAEKRSQYLKNRKAGRVKYKALEWDEIKVRLYGDTAIVTGHSTAKGKDQQGAFDDQRLFTCVFLRRDGRLQVVQTQATIIQKPCWPSHRAALVFHPNCRH